MPQKPNFDWKKIRILGENGMNSKLKHKKARNSICWPVLEEIVVHTWQLIAIVF